MTRYNHYPLMVSYLVPVPAGVLCKLSESNEN